MLQQPVSPSFLHVFNVDSGLWDLTTLDPRVSRRTVEAMNLILIKDGTNAFIGTTSEFGVYLQTRERDHGAATRRFWSSSPEYKILTTLGLFRNTSRAGKPEVAFAGSPLTIAVMFLLEARTYGAPNLANVVRTVKSNIGTNMAVYYHAGTFDHDAYPITWQHLKEALPYLKENTNG